MIRITLAWRDATMHGHGQYSIEDFEDATEKQLTFGVATGWFVYETDEALTLAMDWFEPQTHDAPPAPWRNVSSFPKSGILWIQRETVNIDSSKLLPKSRRNNEAPTTNTRNRRKRGRKVHA